MSAAVWLLHYVGMLLVIFFVLKSKKPKIGLRTNLNIGFRSKLLSCHNLKIILELKL